MSFNPVEYLKAGKVDFVFELTYFDRISLVGRIRNKENKREIINGFLDLLKDQDPKFCFEIIYDIEEYRDTTLYLLDKYKSCEIDYEKLRNILYSTVWGEKYVISHLEEFILLGDMEYDLILKYIFSDFDKHKEFIEKLYFHTNLHIRCLFMKALVRYEPNRIKDVYDDMMKCLTSYRHQEFEQMTFLPELMDMEDISELAVTCFNCMEDQTLWNSLKEYILDNYEENDLAYLLLSQKKYYEKKKIGEITAFENDCDRLFQTSHDYKFQIYTKYSRILKEEILQEYLKYIMHFRVNGEYDYAMIHAYSAGLGKSLEKYIDKYLSMSKDPSVEHLKTGSTSSCYRLGEYVMKLVQMKWSYEEVICPDLYLILPNLEEEFIRDSTGYVSAGLEIQKYLAKSARDLPDTVYQFFHRELERLGYYITDSLVKGSCGDNCFLLDSYKDACCHNPDKLPDIFKEYPIVLVDRDRVYKLENKHPRQLGPNM